MPQARCRAPRNHRGSAGAFVAGSLSYAAPAPRPAAAAPPGARPRPPPPAVAAVPPPGSARTSRACTAAHLLPCAAGALRAAPSQSTAEAPRARRTPRRPHARAPPSACPPRAP
eukprot:scaffold110754_cov69-Phaeocystis_antarctica.AAC.4